MAALLAVPCLAAEELTASGAASAVVSLRGIGAYFNGAPAGGPVPLLIYYRGWVSETNYPGGGLSGGKITGEANIQRSAMAALKFYKLQDLAAEKGLVVLATGSSDIAVTRAEVEALQRELGWEFPRVYAAAHSGGNVGLSASNDFLERMDMLVLLDPFYSNFSNLVLTRTQSGTACRGFFTPHNKARYQRWFLGAGCSVDESFSAADHEGWVAPSLKKNLP